MLAGVGCATIELYIETCCLEPCLSVPSKLFLPATQPSSFTVTHSPPGSYFRVKVAAGVEKPSSNASCSSSLLPGMNKSSQLQRSTWPAFIGIPEKAFPVSARCFSYLTSCIMSRILLQCNRMIFFRFLAIPLSSVYSQFCYFLTKAIRPWSLLILNVVNNLTVLTSEL